MPGVAIVVVSFRTGDTLARCLDDAHRAAPDARAYVVDHESRPAALGALVAARPWALPLGTPENPGFGAGSNRGIAQALADGADHVLLLNDDVYLRPGAVERLVAAAGAAGAASPWLAGEGDGAFRGGAIDWARGYAGHREGADDYLIGGCLCVSRTAWERTGPFDESFFLYCEDVDWCLRARAAGVPLAVVPEELADHVGGASTGGEAWAYWWSRSRIALLRKHGRGHPWRTAARHAAATARDALHHPDARIARARLRGLVDGLRT